MLMAKQQRLAVPFNEAEVGPEGGAAPGVLDLAAGDVGRFVLIDGLSKSHAMTGWRFGFSYCEPDVAAKFTALQSQITSNPSTPTQL